MSLELADRPSLRARVFAARLRLNRLMCYRREHAALVRVGRELRCVRCGTVQVRGL